MTSYKAAILEKVRDVPIYFSGPSAILEKVREMPNLPILFALMVSSLSHNWRPFVHERLRFL